MTCRSPQMLLISLFLGLVYFSGCATKATEEKAAASILDTPQTLTVFAAASLADVFREIARDFEHLNPEVDVVLNLSGSQQLAQQISLGAPADVFAPASFDKMQSVVTGGHVTPRAITNFARNQLVVMLPGDNPANIATLLDLSRPGLKLVLAAEEVPAGKYTRLLLEKASMCESFGSGFGALVLENTVSFEQNVRAVRTKIALGEADAGIVYRSDVYAGNQPTHRPLPFITIDIPPSINQTADYPIAPLRHSPNQELAQLFIRYVLSEKGQQILAQHGFISI